MWGNSQILILGDSNMSILVSKDAEEGVFFTPLKDAVVVSASEIELNKKKIHFCFKIINHLGELNGFAQYHACVKIFRTFCSFEEPAVYLMKWCAATTNIWCDITTFLTSMHWVLAREHIFHYVPLMASCILLSIKQTLVLYRVTLITVYHSFFVFELSHTGR